MSRAIAITQEPEYRALMMFDVLPEGCIAFPCTDQYSQPHIRPGEFVVVDTRDKTPRDGEVYVIQWQSGRRCICQTSASSVRSRRPGETEWSDDPQWIVHSLKRLHGRAIADAQARAAETGKIAVLPGWSDGWFDTDHLREKLVGCVIGLYAPAFEEPNRRASK